MSGRAFDPARHCGAKAHQSGTACLLPKGFGTDHPGGGHCKFHGGSAPGGRMQAARERRFGDTLDSIATLSLSQVAERLARVAAAELLASEDYGPPWVERCVNAFARAAERAEGSKVTIEAKIDFLASIPDEELEAAIAEAERLVNERRARP